MKRLGLADLSTIVSIGENDYPKSCRKRWSGVRKMSMNLNQVCPILPFPSTDFLTFQILRTTFCLSWCCHSSFVVCQERGRSCQSTVLLSLTRTSRPLTLCVTVAFCITGLLNLINEEAAVQSCLKRYANQYLIKDSKAQMVTKLVEKFPEYVHFLT